LHWIRQVLAGGGAVIMRPLVIVGSAIDAAATEAALIRSYRDHGHPLVNGTEGGEGVQGFGGRLSDEALARRNAAMQTPEYRTKRSEQSAAYWSDPSAREHQREAMRAFHQSEAGQALKQVVVETNKRVQTGRTRSAETRAKMAAAKLGKPHARERTPEWNAKIAASNRKPHNVTPEGKARHAAAVRAYWQRRREVRDADAHA
jgi:hypothetical protein